MPSYSLATIVMVLYWVVDFWTMTKYFDQIKTIRRHKKVVGSARAYFLKAVYRELAFLVYCVVCLNCNLILGSLSIIALVLNGVILLLMIKYKKVTAINSIDDRFYDWIKTTLLRSL